jgi:hypothetical protein
MRQPTLEEIKEVADNPMNNSRAPHLWDGLNLPKDANEEIERLRIEIAAVKVEIEATIEENYETIRCDYIRRRLNEILQPDSERKGE